MTESRAELSLIYEASEELKGLTQSQRSYIKGYLACAKQMANEETRADQEKSHDHKQTEGE